MSIETANNQPENHSAGSEAELQSQLSQKVSGLLFPSESESPIQTVVFEKNPLDALKEQYPAKADQIVSADFAEFYDKYAVKKDYQSEARKQFADHLAQALDLMKHNLKNIEVYRIGDVNIDIFILGQDSAGKWTGLQTSVVET